MPDFANFSTIQLPPSVLSIFLLFLVIAITSHYFGIQCPVLPSSRNRMSGFRVNLYRKQNMAAGQETNQEPANTNQEVNKTDQETNQEFSEAGHKIGNETNHEVPSSTRIMKFYIFTHIVSA